VSTWSGHTLDLAEQNHRPRRDERQGKEALHVCLCVHRRDSPKRVLCVERLLAPVCLEVPWVLVDKVLCSIQGPIECEATKLCVLQDAVGPHGDEGAVHLCLLLRSAQARKGFCFLTVDCHTRPYAMVAESVNSNRSIASERGNG
jgi:hypothetical protein